MVTASGADAGLVDAQRPDEEPVHVGQRSPGWSMPPEREGGESPLTRSPQVFDCFAISAEDFSEKGASTPTPLFARLAVRAMVCMK